MPAPRRSTERRQQILEALALMLENDPGNRITTAQLAARVGVSEAALYRHFPSKARMLEELIAFSEDSVFSRINRILAETSEPETRLLHILTLVLSFAERNPGIARLLTGDALTGEHDRLRQRVHQWQERLELALRQVLRDAERDQGLRTQQPANTAARLLCVFAMGSVLRFVQSGFRESPTAAWADEQWPLLLNGLFRRV